MPLQLKNIPHITYTLRNRNTDEVYTLNAHELFDVRLQIAEQRHTGYYFTYMDEFGDTEEHDIDENGRVVGSWSNPESEINLNIAYKLRKILSSRNLI